MHACTQARRHEGTRPHTHTHQPVTACVYTGQQCSTGLVALQECKPLPSLRSVPSSFTPSPSSPSIPCILSLAHCVPPPHTHLIHPPLSVCFLLYRFLSSFRQLFLLLSLHRSCTPSATFLSSFRTGSLFPRCLSPHPPFRIQLPSPYCLNKPD